MPTRTQNPPLADRVAETAAALPDDAAEHTSEVEVPASHTSTADWIGDRAELLAKAASEEFARHLLRDVMTALRTTPNLSKADPYTVLGAAMTCAQLQLRPLNGRAWILPFYDSDAETYRATVIIGYKGLIDLAYRSGLVRSIVARPVFEGEEFDLDYGTSTVLHRPVLRGRPGPAYGYYAQVELLTGGRYPLYMSREQIEDHRDRHARTRTKSGKIIGPWVQEFDAMARKTPLRLVLANVPAESAMQPLATALTIDGRLRLDASPDADPATVSHRISAPAEPDAAAEPGTAGQAG
ncbi:recombination protein RecT [Crossiella equi]|uniref:Recombination protein RecT n=1 Tax=Crossiella equi TaxID=130796 RepID=A0ABS5AN29_9PSEU|nr:recombinase RecT [Crossiella equi]MBP2477647.1 recombination protein RecT [Crossiella equi]